MNKEKKNIVLPLPNDSLRNQLFPPEVKKNKEENKLNITPNQNSSYSQFLSLREDIESQNGKKENIITTKNIDSIEKPKINDNVFKNFDLKKEIKEYMNAKNSYSEPLPASSSENTKEDKTKNLAPIIKPNNKYDNIENIKLSPEQQSIKQSNPSSGMAEFDNLSNKNKPTNKTSNNFALEIDKNNFYSSSYTPLSAKDTNVPQRKEEPVMSQAPQSFNSGRNSSNQSVLQGKEKFPSLKQVAASRLMYPAWMVQGLMG